jgi:hypothetical protein
MLRFTARTLLLFYLVVNGTNSPVDLASGKLARCSEIFASWLCLNGSARVFSESAMSRSDLYTKIDSPVILCRSGLGSELERDGGRRSQNFCFSCGGEFEEK